VLKKAGIAAAVATAGMLALTPLAFADDDQDNHQSSTQSEGTDNGHNYGSGHGDQVICGKDVDLHGGAEVNQDGGRCHHSSSHRGQSEKQHQEEH